MKHPMSSCPQRAHVTGLSKNTFQSLFACPVISLWTSSALAYNLCVRMSSKSKSSDTEKGSPMSSNLFEKPRGSSQIRILGGYAQIS